MKREELLAKGYTEEQVTDLLNTFHGLNKEKDKQIASLQSEILEKSSYESKYNEAQKALDEINKANMTKEEQIAQREKESIENFKKSKILLNKTKAQNILAGLDIEDAILDTLVTDDEQATLNNANLLKAKFDTYKDTIEKQTKESIANLNVKPTGSNVSQDDGTMTWEKFRELSQESQSEWAANNPKEFANL